MENLNYPIKFLFKIGTLANDFTATDASGNTIAYVRQKMFKLKEDISIFTDESRSQTKYKIKADRWLDFSAAYSFLDENNAEFGKVARKGWKSMWKAEYDIIDKASKLQFKIREENGWVKVLDSLIGEIPVLGMFTGYFLNPTYAVTNDKEEIVARLKKQPSFFGRAFEVEKLGDTEEGGDERVMLGLMMMILLERRRG